MPLLDAWLALPATLAALAAWPTPAAAGVLNVRAAIPQATQASQGFEFFPGGTYDPQIPTPAQQLGYPIGSRFTEHSRLLEVVRALAQNERAVLERYGETEERRPLYVAYVSAPETLRNLKQIRADLASLVDARSLTPDAAAKIAERLPIVAWLSYNVHGNEPSPSEAAIAFLYQLVAGTDARTEAIRKNCLIVLDPCVNPDGRDRYVHWYNSIVGSVGDSNPASWERNEPWPGGRFNHYYFDLNRDWAFLTQSESRARVEAYLKTPPQVHVDFHEMGASSSYFFFPPVYPVNANFPGDVVEWAKVFGKGNASAFDKFGWSYYTRENFDLFYPGYGDSWPSFQGAIGMTYEQAGHSSAGVTIRRDDETLLTLRDRTWHHFVASFATCETAVAQRTALLRRFYDWHRTAMEEGERGPVQEYVITEGDDPTRAAALASLLVMQGIQVERAGETFVAGPLRDFDGKEIDREQFPAGTYLVPLAQPRKRLANALLEPSPQMRDLYFYDVSAWSLPRAFGVRAYTASQKAAVRRAPFDGTMPRGKGLEGDPKGAYAYLVDWRQGNAPKLVARLLSEGSRASVASKEFKLGGRTFGRGTVVIPATNNPLTAGADLAERTRQLAEAAGVSVTPVASGLSDDGPDLGSDLFRSLRSRRVALVVGDAVAPSSFGAVRFLLEKSYDLPFTIVPLSRLGSIKLSDFGALVFPDGFYDGEVSKETVSRIREWMAAGGFFVGIGGGGFWATAERSGLTRIRESKAPAEAADPASRTKEGTVARRYVPADLREAQERRRGNPGAILRLEPEPSSSVAFGCGDGPHFVMASNEKAFDPDPETGQPAFLYAPEPKVAGYVGSEASRRLAGQAFAMTSRVGRGRAVLFSEDLNFRLVWQGLTKAFLNALLLPPIRD